MFWFISINPNLWIWFTPVLQTLHIYAESCYVTRGHKWCITTLRCAIGGHVMVDLIYVCVRGCVHGCVCISPEPGANAKRQWGRVGWMLFGHRDGLSSSSFCLILDSSVGFSAGIQSAGDSVSETLWVRIGRQLVSFRFENCMPVLGHRN